MRTSLINLLKILFVIAIFVSYPSAASAQQDCDLCLSAEQASEMIATKEETISRMKETCLLKLGSQKAKSDLKYEDALSKLTRVREDYKVEIVEAKKENKQLIEMIKQSEAGEDKIIYGSLGFIGGVTVTAFITWVVISVAGK
jgi:hypothetical protein